MMMVMPRWLSWKRMARMSSTSARQPGHRLIGDQQLRSNGHGPRQFQLAHLDLREHGRQHINLRHEPDLPENPHHLIDHTIMMADPSVFDRDAEVVERRHAGEGLGDLKAARDPQACPPVRGKGRDVPVLEEDATTVGVERTADAVDQGRLARAVGPMRPKRSPCRMETHGPEAWKPPKRLVTSRASRKASTLTRGPAGRAAGRARRCRRARGSRRPPG
jgi:hypothetical protein